MRGCVNEFATWKCRDVGNVKRVESSQQSVPKSRNGQVDSSPEDFSSPGQADTKHREESDDILPQPETDSQPGMVIVTISTPVRSGLVPQRYSFLAASTPSTPPSGATRLSSRYSSLSWAAIWPPSRAPSPDSAPPKADLGALLSFLVKSLGC
ncbi:hypothetical protein CRENBAI_022307 [Crenichthys baileyi]|uniref:Uncharacterized protein n=1 Tax=Crenichthys baileyi TaxID=28760 RepID=A0AAV9S3L1_9TELE